MDNQTGGVGLPKLMTADEVKKALRMSHTAFHNRLKEGNFLTKIKIGARVFYDQKDVEALINRSRESAA